MLEAIAVLLCLIGLVVMGVMLTTNIFDKRLNETMWVVGVMVVFAIGCMVVDAVNDRKGLLALAATGDRKAQRSVCRDRNVADYLNCLEVTYPDHPDLHNASITGEE